MKALSLSKTYNPNYTAQVVVLDKFTVHPNAERLQIAHVCGSAVVTGLDAKAGDTWVYFPVESVINNKFLSWCNSFSDKELNKDTNVAGFFHKTGRVRMVKLRQVYSNGYIIPFETIRKYASETYQVDLSADQVDSFDTVCGELFVWKYIPQPATNCGSKKNKTDLSKRFNRLIEGQFEFHPDTVNLRYEIRGSLMPTDYITVTKKYHGSCFEVANALVKRKLTLVEKLLSKLGVNVSDREYGRLYASRTVIKDALINPYVKEGFYDADIWGIVADKAFPLLDKGVRITGEIIGWTPSGKMIQPEYDYGVTKGTVDFIVFKVDIVDPDGITRTLDHLQMKHYCESKGFRTPETYYHGRAIDLFPDLEVDDNWHDNFLQKMEQQFLGKRELTNLNKTLPEEGVVLNICKPFGWKALKLKDLEFLGKETKQNDSGDILEYQ